MDNAYFPVPKKVADTAAKALLMRERGFKGGTSTGWDRGEQLSEDAYIKYSDVMEMSAWFARHKYTSYPGFKKWKKDGKPVYVTYPAITSKYRGAVAWMLWGGDEGKRWIDSIIKRH